MRQCSILIWFAVISSTANALELSLGLFQFQDSVQNRAGKIEANSNQLALIIGHKWLVSQTWSFSPRIGVIPTSAPSKDQYGNHKTETIILQYDFQYSWSPQWNSRIGIGNFMKKISGEGGTVTVPNGSGTGTAYRPDRSTTYLGSINAGLDWEFGSGVGIIKKYHLGGLIYLFEPLNTKKSLTAFSLSLGAEF